MKVNPIIEQLLKKAEELNTYIDVNISLKNGQLIYKVDGFYKSGCIDLSENESGVLIAYSRYNQVNTIESFDDLLSLNIEWWQSSKNRLSGWEAPSYGWDKILVDAGRISRKEEINTTVTYSI